MRALYLPRELRAGEGLSLADEGYHHLVNVLRIQAGEEIMLLDGQGGQALAVVVAVKKRAVELSVTALSRAERVPSCDVLLLIPKREALELMLKMAVELGVGRIYLLRGTLSGERLPEERRLGALLSSALEQSNNPWMPEVVLCSERSDVPLKDFSTLLLLDVGVSGVVTVRNTGQSSLLVVGPEGGFTDEERQWLKSHPNTCCVSLATPILRAPTALAAGVGWWLARA